MRFLAAMLVAALIPSAAQSQGSAEAYPSKVIHIINPFSGGGPTDVISRIVADQLIARWHQPVIVEYKTGAGGNIAMEYTAHAAADGYTLVTAPTGPLMINQYIFSKMNYDSFRDFAPISLMVGVDNVLIADPNLPAKNLKELIAYAKANSGKLNFASPGVGSQPHLAGEMFKIATGTDMQHIPYKGTSEGVMATMTGQITMMFAQISAVTSFIESGKVRAIGIADRKRSPLLPGVPTLDEQGLTDFESISIYALLAPKGTPRPIVDKLAVEVARILKEPAVQKRLAAIGMDVIASTPDQLAELMKVEAARYQKIITEGKIRAD